MEMGYCHKAHDIGIGTRQQAIGIGIETRQQGDY